MSRSWLAFLLALPACLDPNGGPPVVTGSTGAGSTSTSDSSGSGDDTTTGTAGESTGSTAAVGDSDSGTTTAPASTSTGTTTGGDMTTGTSGPPAFCGDGKVDPGEECDDGNDNDPIDECNFYCIRRRIVFVTSKEFQPSDIGGLALADGICRQLAGAAGLEHWDTFTAWLSDSKTSAGSRLYLSDGIFARPDGVVVVRKAVDFGSGELEAPIIVDETGTMLEGAGVWTGTLASGSAVPDAQHCNDWTSDSLQVWGHYGSASATDENWTNRTNPDVNPSPCIVSRRMYCIEGE